MKTTRRKKRTSIEIEEDIMNVALSIIEEKGFKSLTLTGIAKAAQVEPSVFYKRFNTLENCIDEVVKRYDYWFSDIFQNYKDNIYSEEGYKYIFNELFSSFFNNKVMQQLLSWELSTSNETTIRTARLREFHTIPLADKFHEQFKDTAIDIRAISSLLVGGIYYLILHRNLSTFSGIDLNTQNGRDRIISSINYLSQKLYSELSPNNEKVNIAKKMKDNNIKDEIIAECTGLQLSMIKNI